MIILQHTKTYNIYDIDKSMDENLALRQIDIAFETATRAIENDLYECNLRIGNMFYVSTSSIDSCIKSLEYNAKGLDLTDVIEEIISTDEGNLTQQDIDTIRNKNTSSKNDKEKDIENIEEIIDETDELIQEMIDDMERQIEEIKNITPVEERDVNIEEIMRTVQESESTTGMDMLSYINETSRIGDWESSGDYVLNTDTGLREHVDENGNLHVWDENGTVIIVGSDGSNISMATAVDTNTGNRIISIEVHNADGSKEKTQLFTTDDGTTAVVMTYNENGDITKQKTTTSLQDGSYVETIREGTKTTSTSVKEDGTVFVSEQDVKENGQTISYTYMKDENGNLAEKEVVSEGSEVISTTTKATTPDGAIRKETVNKDGSSSTTETDGAGNSHTTEVDSDGNTWDIYTYSDGTSVKTGKKDGIVTTVTSDGNGNYHIHQETEDGRVIEDRDVSGSTEEGDSEDSDDGND